MISSIDSDSEKGEGDLNDATPEVEVHCLGAVKLSSFSANSKNSVILPSKRFVLSQCQAVGDCVEDMHGSGVQSLIKKTIVEAPVRFYSLVLFVAN